MLERMQWDSDFFRREIFSLPANPQPPWISRATFLVQEGQADLIQVCIDSAQGNISHLLQESGFEHICGRLTWERQVGPVTADPICVEAGPEDERELTEIARVSFEASRYFKAPFSERQGRELFALWVEKSIKGGFDDGVLAAKVEGTVRGFLSHRTEKDTAYIGLIGVSPTSRGQGIGKILVRDFLGRAFKCGCRKAAVVTQAGNMAAIKLYQGMGFRLVRTEDWFYLYQKGSGTRR